MKYNSYLNSHFSGCRTLGHGHDPHRNREVQFKMLPGEFEVIGITDGVDAWICPLNSPFVAHIKKALDHFRATGELNVKQPRRQFSEESAAPAPKARRQFVEQEEPEFTPRRKTRHVFA